MPSKMLKNNFRIGTRESELALWQANKVKQRLDSSGFSSQLIPIKSDGDLNLTQPIYSMGIQGVFTKALDIALLENRIDIAVHSLKDVPTQLPQGLILGAVLKRGSAKDVLLYNGKLDLEVPVSIATGSLRRKAQWLNRYPNHSIENLRGNVQTRIDKLKNSKWQGAIFAKAVLERMALLGTQYQNLDWMIPAPAQGAVGIVCRKDQSEVLEILKSIHHQATATCVNIEREFLSILEGGCTAPIGAYAMIEKNRILFEGGLFSLDGKLAMITKMEVDLNAAKDLAFQAGKEILSKGGEELLDIIKKEL